MKLRRTRVSPACIALMAGGLSCPAAMAGPGVWTSEGPDGGTALRVAVDPLAPQRVYVTSTGGLFRSNDDGATFQRIEAGLPPRPFNAPLLAIDRQQPQRLWAFGGGNRVFRSPDHGSNWIASGYALSTDDCANAIVDGVGQDELFLATCRSGVRRSIDGGATFTGGGGLPATERVLDVAQDPAAPNQLLAGASFSGAEPGGLFRSVDRGANWFPASGVLGNVSCVSVRYAPAGRAYASCNGVLYRSVDGGATFAVVAGGTVGDDLQVSPADPDTVFSVGRGVIRTVIGPGGATFATLTNGLTPNGGYGGPVVVRGIALRPDFAASATAWIASGAGVYRSTDGGASWQTRQVGIRTHIVRGLSANPAPGVPLASRRLLTGSFADLTPGFPLQRSDDGGASWTGGPVGLQAGGIRALVHDPTHAGPAALARVYAAGRALSDPIAGTNGGLYRSLDGGLSWESIDGGLPATGAPPNRGIGTVFAFALHPRSCANRPASGPCTTGPLRTAWAGGSGRLRPPPGSGVGWRVLRSGNVDLAGAPGPLWEDVDGLPQAATGESLSVLALALDPNDEQVAYAALVVGRADTQPPASAGGVYRTSNGGSTWQPANGGLPLQVGSATTPWNVLALAHHPTQSLRLWAVASEKIAGPAPGSSRIYRTVDGGATWVRSDTGIPADVDLRVLRIDPGAPMVLYAGGIGSPANPGGVYRSDDGGLNWRSISIGLPPMAVLALDIDPLAPNVLRAGTLGSTWVLEQLPDTDGDGAPDTQEDAAPNGGDGNDDGVPDSTQGDVGSTIVLLRGAGACGGFTSELVGGTCSQAVDVAAEDALRYGVDPVAGPAPRAWAYPYGLVRVQLPSCASAQLHIVFHGAGGSADCPAFDDLDWRFRFQGPAVPGDDASVGWHDLGARAERLGPRSWRVRLDAGAFGSYRPDGGSVLFLGGPAFGAERVFDDGFEPR